MIIFFNNRQKEKNKCFSVRKEKINPSSREKENIFSVKEENEYFPFKKRKGIFLQ